MRYFKVDASFVKVHKHASGAVVEELSVGKNFKIHMIVAKNSMPLRILVTDSTTADITEAEPLVSGLSS